MAAPRGSSYHSTSAILSTPPDGHEEPCTAVRYSRGPATNSRHDRGRSGVDPRNQCWNVSYDVFLRMDMPVEIRYVGYDAKSPRWP